MIRSLMRSHAADAWWWLLPAITLLVSAAIQVSHGVFFSMFLHDMFVPLEGAQHLRYGHWPHRDFGSPIGDLYFVLHYLPTLVAPLSARTLIYANLLAALLISSSALLLARHRMPLWLASLTALYLGLVASSPRQIGERFDFISNNASYNRFAWAIIGLLALIAACPRDVGTRRSSLVDGFAVGLLLAALFFIKLTYAGAAIGIVILATLMVRPLRDWRFPAAALGLFLGLLLLLELTTGQVQLYIADVRTAASAAGSGLLRPLFAARLLIYSATGAAAALVVGLLHEWDRRRLQVWVPRTLLSLATVLAGVAIGIQNHPELENPLLPIAVLVAGCPGLAYLRRRAAAAPSQGQGVTPLAERLTGRACVTGFLALAAVTALPDLAAVGWTAMAPRARGGDVAWLAATPLADLRLHEQNPGPRVDMGTRTNGEVDLTGVIGDGVALLRPHVRRRPDARVFPLTFSNPFPALLALPPVRHELAWWHEGRTFSQELKPDPALLLDNVDYVLIPKRYTAYATVAAIRQAYAPEIERRFRVVDQNRSWTLLARRDCARRALC